MTQAPHVLFVCTHNAGRSQMAAALLDQQAAGRVQVTSAGSQPASELNPAVVQAMAEIGLDISREFPKPLTGDKVQAADIIVPHDQRTGRVPSQAAHDGASPSADQPSGPGRPF